MFILDNDNSLSECTFIITGEMNIDIIGSNEKNDYIDIMNHYEFGPYMNMFTRTPSIGNYSCMDNIRYSE